MNGHAVELDRLREALAATLYPDGEPIRIGRGSKLRSVARRSPFATAGCVAVGLAGVGIAVAATTTGGVTPAEYNHGARAQVVTTVAPTVSSSFSVLTGSVTAADALPASFVAMHQNSPLVGELGVNLKLAHLARGVTDGTAWVVPGDSGVCLVVSRYSNGEITGTGCSADASVIAGQTLLTAGTPSGVGGEFIAGLVPDGVEHVSLHFVGRSSETLIVHDNVYTTDVTSGSPSTLTFSGPNGTKTLKVANGG
jgi:hypothetical protein